MFWQLLLISTSVPVGTSGQYLPLPGRSPPSSVLFSWPIPMFIPGTAEDPLHGVLRSSSSGMAFHVVTPPHPRKQGFEPDELGFLVTYLTKTSWKVRGNVSKRI